MLRPTAHPCVLRLSILATLGALWTSYDSRLCNAADSVGAQADTAVTEKDADVFGFKLHYREAGSGPTVILLHGLGGDGSRWTSTMSELSGDFRVIALDQLGFGASDKPLVDYNHALLAQFLEEFIRVLEVSKASLVGHSMGGFVALYATAQHPAKFDRLILLDGGGFNYLPRTPHLQRIQNGTTLAETREYFELMFHDKSRVTDAMVRENFARRLRVSYAIGKMQAARRQGLGLIAPEQAAKIEAPTLIVWGKHDALLDPATARELQRAIPNSRAVLIDNAGHLPQVEQPELFNRLVKDFLTTSNTDTISQPGK